MALAIAEGRMVMIATRHRSLLCLSASMHPPTGLRRQTAERSSLRLYSCIKSTAGAAEQSDPPSTLAGGTLDHGLDLASLKISVSGRELTLVVPESIDKILDMYIDSGREDRDPYWARPWHSAVALAEELLECPELVRGKSVVDVGAGLGLGGIAALLAGASRVVLLDREPLALQCALLSASACGVRAVADPRALGPISLPEPSSEAPTLVRDLLNGYGQATAGEEGDEEPKAEDGNLPRVTAGLLDWLSPEGLEQYGRFDVVIACDVLYEDFSVEPVAALLPRLLPRTGGEVLLADPPNRTPANRERFLQLVRAQLDDVRLVEAGRRTAQLDGRAGEVQVLLFRRNYGSISSTIGLK